MEGKHHIYSFNGNESQDTHVEQFHDNDLLHGAQKPNGTTEKYYKVLTPMMKPKKEGGGFEYIQRVERIPNYLSVLQETYSTDCSMKEHLFDYIENKAESEKIRYAEMEPEEIEKINTEYLMEFALKGFASSNMGDLSLRKIFNEA